ncbi:MAG TPA: PKD domain-containing protein [Flavipsychrobacter sp.]|nr:PKD domain-containing protein [Flavipsychrobacter sp.]
MKIILYPALLVFLLLFSVKISAQAPVANFTATPISGCNPLHVSFTSTSTGNPTSYSWNLGNGVTTIQQNPTTTYTTPGTYPVTLTVTNANGSNTKTVSNYITVFPGPAVNFTASPMSGCPPLVVNFTNTTTSTVPGTITYAWNFGDGSPLSSTTNPTHSYNFSANAILTATDAQGCINSKPLTITVHQPPIINFTAITTQCDAPAAVNFTANITGTAPFFYQWSFGDGGSANIANPSHTYTNPGVYTVTLIVTDGNGCKDTLVKNNYMNVGNLVPNFTFATGCVGTPVSFTNTSNVMDSVRWYFGDGSTDTAKNPQHIYNSSGTFTVKLYVYKSFCKDSVIKQITVNPKPLADFSMSPCPPTIQFTNLSVGAQSYIWDFGDGSTSTTFHPTHTYSLIDTALYPKLIAFNSFGCTDTSYMEDTVLLYYVILGGVSPNGFHCVGDTAIFRYNLYTFDIFDPLRNTIKYPYSITSVFWNFDDGGATSTLDSATHIYSGRGKYRPSVTITTSNGCTYSDTFQVLVGHKPTASFTFSPDTVCNHGTVTFINNSINAQWYLWDFRNGGSYADTTGGVYTYTYQMSGIDTVILYAFDYGCVDTFKANRPVVVRPPTALWNFEPICENPKKVQFYDTLSIEPTSHWWSFGDGDTSSARNPLHTYPALGTYVVSLYTYNSIYGCTDTLTRAITLIDPVLTFTTPDTAICEGDSITFFPNYTVTPEYDYNWYIQSPGGYPLPWWYSSRTVGSWGFRFNQRGIYQVYLLASDGLGCIDTFVKTILVAQPEAGFVATPSYGCAPENISFLDTTTNVPGAYQITRQWDFGNGQATSNGPGISNLYAAAGLYTVQLIVVDNVGCTDTAVSQNYIDIRDPVPGFTVSDSNACMKELLAFQNTTTGSNNFTSVWYFGDGTSDTAKNPVHAYQQVGAFTVKLVVTDSIGCKDSITKVAYINITKPTAQFSASDTLSICPPLNVLFYNSSVGALTYAWNLGNGTNSNFFNPTGSYVNPGLYQIQLIATNAENCRDTAYGTVRVLGYAGGLTYSPLKGCAPLEVGFKAELFNIPSVIWDFSDGVTKSANGSDTTSHVYTTPGAYVPKLILSDNTGCQNSSLGLDTIKVDGVDAGFITASPCINTPVTFIDTSFSYFSNIISWRWNFNNGQYTNTTKNPTYTFNTAGTYPVKLVTVNANGCTDSISTTFVIHDLPKIIAVSDTSICKGDAAQLFATGGVSYVWTPALTLSCDSCQSPLATPPTTTNYVVTGTDGRGCKNKDTVKVTIQLATTSTVANGGDICQDSSFQLNAYGAQRYEWTPAETLNDRFIANPMASPSVTTLYRVIAWEGSCPSDTNTVRVVVHPKPSVDAGTDVTIVAGTNVMLNAKGSNIETYLWSPAQTLSCNTCSNPYANPQSTTMYKVVAMSLYGCKAYDTVIVRVLCDESQLFIPNTFSPNNDGQNDIFYPRGVGLKSIRSFRIYNRWGELLFEKRGIQLNDRTNGWDGTYRGSLQNPDVFVYAIDGECENGEPISWKGDISLLR